MKQTVNKITAFVTDNEIIGRALFIFIFCSRIFLDLIINKIFGLGEDWQHYIFEFYKYNYIVIFSYMFFYELCYLYRYHRFHLNKIQWLGILYACIAIIATYAYLREKLAYDYFTKLSLGEMMMSMIFIFDVGTKLTKKHFEKTLELCSWFYLGLTFFINAISLFVFFFNIRQSFVIWGRTIVPPDNLGAPGLWMGTYPYPGFYYNTSITGLCCSLAVFLLVWLFRTMRINKIIFALLLVTNLYCLFLSSNRTGAIGVLVFLFLLVIEFVHTHVKEKKKRSGIYTLLTIIIFGFFMYILLRTKNIMFIATTLFSDPFAALDNLSSARMRILQSVLKIVKERPLLGNGWNYRIPIEGSDTVFPYAHNIFLGALAWTGLTGFVIFVKYFFLVFRQSIKKSRNIGSRVLLFIIIVLTLQGQFENGILGDWNHAYTYIFWFIAGFLCGINN